MTKTMTFYKRAPWHGLGTYVGSDKTVSSKEALELGGLNWRVKKHAISCDVPMYRNGEYHRTEKVEDPNHSMVVRNTDLKSLGVVGSKYTPYQNEEAFAFLDGLSGPFGEIVYDSVGSLRGGRQVWMLAQLKGLDFEVGKGDQQKQYLLLRNSHDGSSALRCFFVSVRVVCANGMLMASQAAGKAGISIRHTGNIKKRLEAAQSVLGIAKEAVQEYRDLTTYLSGLRYSRDDAKAFLETLVPDPKGGRNHAAKKKRDTLYGLYSGDGDGSQLEGVQGTAWGLLNAVTQYTSHEAGKDREKRLESQWFGQGNDLNQRAKRLLTKINA